MPDGGSKPVALGHGGGGRRGGGGRHKREKREVGTRKHWRGRADRKKLYHEEPTPETTTYRPGIKTRVGKPDKKNESETFTLFKRRKKGTWENAAWILTAEPGETKKQLNEELTTRGGRGPQEVRSWSGWEDKSIMSGLNREKADFRLKTVVGGGGGKES